MKLALKEPRAPRYIYIDRDNVVHILMPVVSGSTIGLDNTCESVSALTKFFGKGTHQESAIKRELDTYKEALEQDLSLLEKNTSLAQQKQHRLAQINTYLEVINYLENHSNLECLNAGFPTYPEPLAAMIKHKLQSNFHSMILRPENPDAYLRSEVMSPLFTVAHDSVLLTRMNTQSTLQKALITAYTPLKFVAQNYQSQLIKNVLDKTTGPFDFAVLKQTLRDEINTLIGVDINFEVDAHGTAINQAFIAQELGIEQDTPGEQDIEHISKKIKLNTRQTRPSELELVCIDDNVTARAYIDALLGYCANDLFANIPESPFNKALTAEQWSIATQFLLGISNFYACSWAKLETKVNWGAVLDNSPALSTSLAQIMATAQKAAGQIPENELLAWINGRHKQFGLTAPFTPEEIHLIKTGVAERYTQISESQHFDEFYLLDTESKGDFFSHQGSICVHLALFACSDSFKLPLNMRQALEQVLNKRSTLSTKIPHEGPKIQEHLELTLSSMDKQRLQNLYEFIDTYTDISSQKQLLTQLRQERPDFIPPINPKKFLQHVAYGQQSEAETLLQDAQDAAQKLLTTRNIAFTDYSGRTFTCTAYEYAYWAMDSHMRKMLEQYMDSHTKALLLGHFHKNKELVGDGLFKKAKGITYSIGNKIYHSEHFNLTLLIEAYAEYAYVFEAHTKYTLGDEYLESEDIIINDADIQDPGKLEARLYSAWDEIGLLQQTVPAHIAQEYCQKKSSIDFQDIEESLLSSELERTHIFYDIDKPHVPMDWFAASSKPLTIFHLDDRVMAHESPFTPSRLGDEDKLIGEPDNEYLFFKQLESKRKKELDESLIRLSAETIRLYEQAIKQGNANAMTNRARMHQYGQGGPKDEAKAIRLYERAIKQSNADAMTYRALMHQYGQGGLKNEVKAIGLYEHAINLGHADAMTHRALMHQKGLGAPKDEAAAIRLYEHAISLGHADAMNNRALMHQNGLGGLKDETEAIRIYEQAIKLGHADAMNNRAFMHHEGLGGPQNTAAAIHLYEQAISLGHAGAMNNRARMHEGGWGGSRNEAAAIRLYEHAISLGNADAMNNRAFMHEEGLGDPENEAAAIRLYEHAIGLRHAGAMTNRARMHQYGQGGPKNEAAAIPLYEHAIRLGDAEAMTYRALMHQKGLGGPKNEAEAIRLYEQAIGLDNAGAMNNRAYMHQYGLGGPKNEAEAIRLYEQAISLEHTGAMINRASMHQKGLGGPKNEAEAIRLYERAIGLGRADAMFSRASMHQYGQGGPKNEAAAIRLYEQAIELGHADAMSNRAFMHQYGLGGPKNEIEAISLYEHAIKLGHVGAMNNRAFMHQQGLGGPKNTAEAIRLYEYAIGLRNANAINNRAFMHQKGLGGPKDEAEAIRLYEQAIEMGNTEAMNNRAFMYQEGLGGPKNEAEAIRLYEHAINLGNARAESLLAALRHRQKIANEHSDTVNLAQNNSSFFIQNTETEKSADEVHNEPGASPGSRGTK